MVNKRTRIKRKALWDQKGVSEVIGTILTMTLTVILFSGVFLMVQQIPAPGDNAFSHFHWLSLGQRSHHLTIKFILLHYSHLIH